MVERRRVRAKDDIGARRMLMMAIAEGKGEREREREETAIYFRAGIGPVRQRGFPNYSACSAGGRDD